MKYVLKSRAVRNITCAAFLLMLSACAATVPKEQAVEQRVMARWDAYFDGNLPAVYEFFSPGFRSSVSLMQYQRSVFHNKVNWTDANYVGSDCTETTCKIKISLDYTVIGAVPGLKSFSSKQEIEESWVWVNGNWYLVPKD